jgi:hypothetical protein
MGWIFLLGTKRRRLDAEFCWEALYEASLGKPRMRWEKTLRCISGK